MRSDWTWVSFLLALCGAVVVALLFISLTSLSDPAPAPARAQAACSPSPFGPDDLVFCQEGGRAVAYQLRGGRKVFAGFVDPQARPAVVPKN